MEDQILTQATEGQAPPDPSPRRRVPRRRRARKPSSPARIASSRANGAKSRGPVTPQGKQRSSRNAITHGMLADTIVQQDENRSLFLEIVRSLETSLRPANALAYLLVQNMAVSTWRQYRAFSIETSSFDQNVSRRDRSIPANHRAAQTFGELSDSSRVIDLLHRYESRADRQFARALRLFREINQPDPNYDPNCQTNPVAPPPGPTVPSPADPDPHPATPAPTPAAPTAATPPSNSGESSTRPTLSLDFMAQILDGNRVRDEILAELKPQVAALAASGKPPGLAVVLAGNNPASEIYVRSKIKACHDLGIFSESITPGDSVTTTELLDIVSSLNARPDIHGILVQLPLPKQADEKRILMAIAPEKDVDGFHPCNAGKLMAGLPAPRACTPAGIVEILKRSNVPIAGKRAVVLGRSDIVGKPVALLLLHENATVTICHSKTADLPGVCREADILVAAIGRPAMVTADYMKPGSVVVDVGINRLTDRADVARIFRNAPEKLASFDKRGSVIVGDVDPIDAAAVSSAYTPVPGGVGPLTIAMLMSNTVAAARQASQQAAETRA